jgi:hypothetical protein
MTRKKTSAVLLASAMVSAALLLGALAGSAQATLRHLDGTVLSKDAQARTFRIATESGARVRIKVNANTEFERIAGGFGGLRAGMRIEVDAQTTASGLLARQIEPQGGNEGGADDDGGDDDRGGHGGSDDGPNHT